MRKLDKKAFTLIELIVVVAVVGILVLLGMPRFIGHKDKAELARIQHDVKVMEQEIVTMFINNDDFNNWENNNKDFNQLIQENRLFEKEGVVSKVESIDKTYKIIPEKYKDKINTKLKGTFYTNNNGKVYYEHEKPLLGIPIKPEEKEPGYSDEEIQDLRDKGYIPIATAEELNSIRNTSTRTYGKGTKWEDKYEGGLDKKYIQVANLDLSEYSEEGWNPIGTYISRNDNEGFTGIYDGGNYVIRGLEVKGEDKDYQGLFRYTKGATLRNVGLIDNKVTGADDVGGLVGAAHNGTKISNSYATGSVEGSGEVGGLVGWADSEITIENSYTTGSVIGTSLVGGLVGYADSEITIDNSYATGSVIGTSLVGGLVGYANSEITIENSYATGSVTSSGTETWESSSVGGLVGSAGNFIKISNSYAEGSVTGTGGNVGGLVGYVSHSGDITNSYATGSVTGSRNEVGGLVGYAYSEITISNSYATGLVTATGNSVGGLVGYAQSIIIENSYATGSVTGTNYVGGLVGEAYDNIITSSYWDITMGLSSSAGGEGKTTNEMKNHATYLGWDFEETWKIDEGNDYPKLR